MPVCVDKTLSAPMLSIVCPVYNCSKYLRQLLERLCNQTQPNFQLVLIDDHSDDDSPDIIKQYENNFLNVTVVRNESNRGPGYSKNVGLQFAQGDILAFIDADDLVKETYVEHVYQAVAQMSDNCWSLLYFNLSRFSDTKEMSDVRPNLPKKILNREKLLKQIIDDRYLGGYLVNKIFKTEILKKYNIKLVEDILVSEDELFCLEYVLKCDRTAAYKIDNEYFYRDNPLSLTNTNLKKKLSDMVRARVSASKLLAGTRTEHLARGSALIARIYCSFYNETEKITKCELVKNIPLIFFKYVKRNDKLCYLLYILSSRLAKKIYFKRKSATSETES